MDGFSIWRMNLQPASYNGIDFKVEMQGRSGGRRNVEHEFPKKSLPAAEDMGRRARKFTISAYIIYSPVLNPDWEANRDDLINELESGNPGTLILPTGLHVMNDEPLGAVVVDTYTVTEHREKGGWCEFEIVFMEAGQPAYMTPAANTQGIANTAATAATTQFQNSSDLQPGQFDV